MQTEDSAAALKDSGFILDKQGAFRKICLRFDIERIRMDIYVRDGSIIVSGVSCFDLARSATADRRFAGRIRETAGSAWQAAGELR